MNNKKDSGNLSSDKLLRIIEGLAACRQPSRLTDLSEKLGIPQPTALRYLKTLCSQGYAYQDDNTGCYALTWKICLLGDAVKTNLTLRSIASPILREAANEIGAGTLLAVESNGRVLYLDYIDNPRWTSKTFLRIGRDAPIYASASGKILLSSFSRHKVESIMENAGLEHLTPKTITNPDTLFTELAQIQRQHYSIDDEECELGYRCVSVPVYDYTGLIVAAISAFDSIERLSMSRIEDEVVPQLKKYAGVISGRLGYFESI